MRIMWTHFHPASKTLFDVTDCETCGRTIEAPNAVTGCDPVEHYRKMGLLIVTERLPQGYYDDDTGMEVCDGCIGTCRNCYGRGFVWNRVGDPARQMTQIPCPTCNPEVPNE